MEANATRDERPARDADLDLAAIEARVRNLPTDWRVTDNIDLNGAFGFRLKAASGSWMEGQTNDSRMPILAANAAADVPALIAEVRRLERALDELRAAARALLEALVADELDNDSLNCAIDLWARPDGDQYGISDVGAMVYDRLQRLSALAHGKDQSG